MDVSYLDDEDEIITIEDPIDLAEAVLGTDSRFAVDRSDGGDLSFTFKAAWCSVTGFLGWREELPAVLLTVAFDLNAPDSRIAEAARLIAMINENLWLGHFDLWSEDGSIVFRHSIPMVGRSELTPGEVQALLAATLDAADRFYPAFDNLLRCGSRPEQAIEAAMFETIGEA
ncbi:MAG TPA: YbjN domain-containing protein [Caulobacterales bacterium]|nr:YbjN domain-containing protein [Caulobacterales bacterium]